MHNTHTQNKYGKKKHTYSHTHTHTHTPQNPKTPLYLNMIRELYYNFIKQGKNTTDLRNHMFYEDSKSKLLETVTR